MSKTNSSKRHLTTAEAVNLIAFGIPSENGAQQWREEQVPFIKPPDQPKGAKPTKAESEAWQEYENKQKALAERARLVAEEETRLTEAAKAEIERAGEAGDFEATGKKARGHRETVPKTDWTNGRIDPIGYDPSDGGPDCDYGTNWRLSR